MEPANELIGEDSPDFPSVLLKAMADRVLGVDERMRTMVQEMGKIEALSKSEQILAEKVAEQQAALAQLQGAIGLMKEDVALLLEKASVQIPVALIEELRKDLAGHVALFERPLEKSIHHKHFLGKPVWVIAGMACLVLGLLYLLNRNVARANSYEANDIKWRYLKQTHDSVTLHEMEYANDAYLANPQQFSQDVRQEEERRAQLYERWLQVNEGVQEIDRLNSKEKKR